MLAKIESNTLILEGWEGYTTTQIAEEICYFLETHKLIRKIIVGKAIITLPSLSTDSSVEWLWPKLLNRKDNNIHEGLLIIS